MQSHASRKGVGLISNYLWELPKGLRLRRRMMNPLLCLLATWSVSFAGATPLDDYVNAPDSTYRYEDMGDPYIGDGFRSHFINLTSQTWLTRERLRERPRTDWNESVETFYLIVQISSLFFTTLHVVLFLRLISPGCWPIGVVALLGYQYSWRDRIPRQGVHLRHRRLEYWRVSSNSQNLHWHSFVRAWLNSRSINK